MERYFDSEGCTKGFNSIDAYVSCVLRSSFPDMEFSDESEFTGVFFSEDIRECLLVLEQLDSVIEVAKKELNPACSKFSESSLCGSYHGAVRMADGSVKRLDLVLTAIEDNNCKNLCSCVVKMSWKGMIFFIQLKRLSLEGVLLGLWNLGQLLEVYKSVL